MLTLIIDRILGRLWQLTPQLQLEGDKWGDATGFQDRREAVAKCCLGMGISKT